MSWSVHSLFLYLAFIDVNAQNSAFRMCVVDNCNEIDKAMLEIPGNTASSQ